MNTRTVTNNHTEAVTHALACLAKPDGVVVIEEFLDGPEISLFCISDGTEVRALAPAQDFKRIGVDDTGPNTGGMGSYSPVPGIDAERAEEITQSVHQPVVDLLRSRGAPFRGVLYAGLMMTASGPKVPLAWSTAPPGRSTPRARWARAGAR